MGQSDIPLNATGQLQAQRLAERFAEFSGLCLCSDLSRARDTARALAKNNSGLQILEDVRLREIAFGKLEGTTPSQWPVLFPAESRAYQADPLHAVPPGGESRQQLMDRVESFVHDLLQRPEDHFLIVTHGGTLAALFNLLLGWETRQPLPGFQRLFRFDNSSVTAVEFNDPRWRVLLTNCTRHLL